MSVTAVVVSGRCLLVAAAISVGVGLGPAAGASVPGPPAARELDIARIDRYLHAEMRRHGLPGLSVGIVEGDRVAHLAAFGKGLDPDTPIVLASVSKPVTATAVMQLVDTGQVSLDAPVRTYLPDFRVADEVASAGITVRQLLNHTSGLPPSSCEIEADGLEQYLVHLRAVRLDRPVGSRYEYCSGNYNVLGLLVERVSGMPFDRYMQERVFAPLAMTHSSATDLTTRPGRVARGHQWLFGFPVSDHYYNPSGVPSGYLESSARDMAHFLVAHLNGGRYGLSQVVSAAAVAAMHEPSVRSGAKESYGLGWITGSQGGVAAVYHYGTNYDVMTFVVLEPRLGRGAVLLVPGQTVVATTAMRTLETGLSRLLAGEPPPPGAMNLHLVYAFLDAVVVVLLVGVAMPLARLRRWAYSSKRRAHSKRAWTRAACEMLGGLLLLAALRFLFAQLGANWFQMFRSVPDFAGATALISVLLVATGIVRIVALASAHLSGTGPEPPGCLLEAPGCTVS